ncbi:ATP-binding cassette sub- C member 8 [Sarracenia purpurea var. burkii]
MASFGTSIRGFSWICEGEIDFISSSCLQGAAIDALNLLFLLAFYISLLIGYIKKHNISSLSRRDWVTISISICSALISTAYLSFSFWDLITQNRRFSSLSWVVHSIRGLIWISLTVSLIVQGSKWVKILASVWWLVFFVLISALNTEVFVRNHATIQILDIAAWLVTLLLFFSALRNFISHFFFRSASEKVLSEPLLVEFPERNHSKIGHASLLSKLTFSWINPLLRLGYSKFLALEDIPDLVPKDESVLAYDKFASAWDSLRREKSSNDAGNLVFWSLARVYKKEMVFVGICAFLRTFSVVVGPLLLYGFVNYSNRDTKSTHEGLFLVGCLVFAKVTESLSQRHFFFNSRRAGMRMRSALMVAVYQKQLKLSSLGRSRHSTGEVVNYIAVDAYRMGEFPMWFHLGWSFSLQLFLAVTVLFGIVGLGALPGLVPLLICGLLNLPYAKLLQKCQFELMKAQDQRLRSMSEILNNMKIIKLQSWEDKFKKLIESYRENEFKWLADSQFKKAYGTAIYWMSPTIVSSVIFFGCAITGSAPFDASTIFTVLAVLRSMAEPVRMIPEALSAIIQVKVSFDRIENFLLDEELKKDKSMTIPWQDSDTGIKIHGGNFSWDPDSATPTLGNVDMEVGWGQKVAVCGQVGAGKSSLLYAILGEIPKSSGNVSVCGSIAYVSQTSWIQSGTIRDNILYGKPMEKTRYEKAVKACDLDKDLNNFEHGDLTEIGQRGLNMSGGQKQRIQLARAVYNDADIYLLDDPFSAVDAHTAAILFNDCVMTALEKKTVILVTHQVEFLSQVDKILVIEGGEITQSGSYTELLMIGTAFEQLVNAHRNSVTALDPRSNENRSEHQNGNADRPEETIRKAHLSKENSEGEISGKDPPRIQLTEDEEKEIGDVGWKPFFDYIVVSKGLFFVSSSVIAQSAFVALQAGSSYWLAFAIKIPNLSSGVLIGVYAVISTISTFFVYLRSRFTALLGLKASKAFFSGFVDSIFSAPMLFFDSTPVGRILTRASSDFSVLDFDVPFTLSFVYASGIELVVTIAVMSSVTWQVLIVAVFAALASQYVQGYYQASARELMRINGTTKAPVMNYAAETSLGVVTIRAFNVEQNFFHNYLNLVDTDAKLNFYSNAAMEWLILRVETFQNLTLFTAAFLIVLLPKGYIPPGLVGLSLSYALALTGTQVFLTRWYSSLCNFIISVERIKQFMHIPPEPPAIVEDKRPPSSWPSKGRIELKDLKIRYRPNSPLVLKGITCTFREGAKVGVVGRTGSGKTTLISALFRLVEPDSGKILIDGLDICSIGLKDLRMKLSIIPQEPTLFRGSVRTNLDPLGLYADEEIWKALEKCQLKATISNLPNLLDSSVSDEGENWSAGQRQLFCLGRVLLSRNRILILDEATASIDSATDALLQTIIRQEFSNCTVITVAHRVPTVVDSDMVMVLSFGKVVEYDEPSKLMETSSSFAKLVAEYWSSCKGNSAESFNVR